jgi:hypothetical protein
MIFNLLSRSQERMPARDRAANAACSLWASIPGRVDHEASATRLEGGWDGKVKNHLVGVAAPVTVFPHRCLRQSFSGKL